MKQLAIFATLLVTIGGCSSTNNPVSPITDTIQSHNLQFTFSIPRPSYGTHDTLVAAMKAYNPGDTTVIVYIPVCWPIAWYSVQDSSGTTRLSYAAPRNVRCNSVIEYSVLPHQSQQVSMLDVKVPIVELDTTQTPQGSYLLTVDNGFGTFSLKFTVN